MILKSLALKNFRIYKGSGEDGYERINFSSGDKNITIIQGNNEVGKTTIMNALTWCLYNKEFYKKEGKKPIWNSFAADQLENGEEDFVEVSIEMEDESNNIVTFKRILNFYKNDLGKVIRGNSTFEITASLDGLVPYLTIVAFTSYNISPVFSSSPFIIKYPFLGSNFPNLLKEALISSIPEK